MMRLTLLALLSLHRASSVQRFRVEPANASATEGGTATLPCEVLAATGAVQWAKDGLLLGPERAMPGFPRYTMAGTQAAGQFSLRIDGVSLEDDGWFQCQAGGSESRPPITSRTAWLTVLIPPQRPVIADHAGMDSVTWVAGVSVTVSCTASDAKPSAEVQWKRGEEVIAGVEHSVQDGSQPKLFDSTAVIKFTPRDSDNGLTFSCSALNPALQAPRVTSLRANVHFPPGPPRVEGLDGRPLREGDKLNLRCEAKGGNPLATLQWSKGDEVLLTTWESDEVSTPPVSRSVLPLVLRPEHNLVALTCEATNLVAPTPVTTTVTLHVLFAPAEVTLLGFPDGSGLVENQTLSVACLASSSNPPARIRWWLGGRQLTPDNVTNHDEGPNGGHVTVSNLTHAVSREHNGVTITCEAANEAMFTTRTATKLLHVYYRPERVWIEGYDGKVVPVGTILRIKCFASGGHPSASLVWTKGLTELRGGEYRSTGTLASREITVATAPSDNGAVYSCAASNKASSRAQPLRNSTRLHVHFPPRDVKVRLDEEGPIHAGTPTAFVCQSSSSHPACTLHWIKDGKIMPGVPGQSRRAEYGGWSSSGSINLTLGSRDHGRRLTCQATHQLLREKVNSFYKLDVLFAPELEETQLMVVSVRDKSAAFLKLHILANPSDVTVTWSRAGKLLVQEGVQRYVLKEGGSLEIWNITRADAGTYDLEMTNSEGSTRASIQLDVQYHPSIVRPITTVVYVEPGGTATIVCTFDANPVLPNMVTWRWLSKDGPVPLAGLHVYGDGASTLTLAAVNRSMAGGYECAADNGIAPPARRIVQLLVKFPPEMVKSPHLAKVASAGDGTTNATLVCRATGVPTVTFSWAKNNVTIKTPHPRYLMKEKRDMEFREGRLEVVNASAALDYAIFTCTARNDMGADSFDIQLVSTSRPDPPTGVRVLSVTHNSATVTWTPGFNGGLDQRFLVRFQAQGSPSAFYVDVFPPQATEFSVPGLRAGTAYNVSVSAQNRLGHSAYHGEPVGIRTAADIHDGTGTFTPVPSVRPDSGWVPSMAVMLALGAGGVAIVVNAACLVACSVRKKRTAAAAAAADKKLQEMSASPNQYGAREAINPSARRTLITDSGSEHSYATYGTEDSQLYTDITSLRSSTLTTQETLSRTDSYYSTVGSWVGPLRGGPRGGGGGGGAPHIYHEPPGHPPVYETPDDSRAPLYDRPGREDGARRGWAAEPIAEEPLDFDDDEEMEPAMPFEMRGDLV